MGFFNHVTLMGTVRSEPKTTHVAGQKRVTTFKLSVLNWGGGKRKYWTNVPVNAWNRLGDAIREHVRPGMNILVEGQLAESRWKDEDTGRTHVRLTVLMRGFRFTGRKGDDEAAEAEEAGPDTDAAPGLGDAEPDARALDGDAEQGDPPPVA